MHGAALVLLTACLLGSGVPEGEQSEGKSPDAGPAQSEPSAVPGPSAADPSLPEQGVPPGTGARRSPSSKPSQGSKPAPASRPASRRGPAAKPSAPAQAQGATDRVLDDVQAHYERVHDLRASFVQESTVASMGRKDTSRGTVAVKRPGRMRWEYSAPEPRVLMIDSQTVKMYSPGEHQLQVAPLDPKSFSPTALTFLLGTGDLRESFSAELIEAAGRKDVGIRLHPKSDASFEFLELWLAPTKWTLRESVVVDLFGNRTSVQFSDVAENAPVPESTFKLDVPPETEVIDLR